MKFSRILLLLLPVMLAASGCKPTEKNYRDAYEVASRRQQDAVADMGIPAGTLLGSDLWSWRVVDGDSIRICHSRISVLPEQPDSIGKDHYGVVVGIFSMHTNAGALASDLRADPRRLGLNKLEGVRVAPLAATDGRDRYFTIAALAPALKDATAAARYIEEHSSGFRFVGIPAPLIIYIPGQ